jgi:Flp pilus assembly protein TadG
MILQKSLHPAASEFATDEAGSSTVEAVMWLPLFFFITVFVLDASMMFNTQSRALRIVQDTNRALAVGQIATPEDAEQVLLARMADISPSATVNAAIVDNIAETSVAMPLRDISMFHTFDAFTDFEVTASSQQLIEN